MRVLSLEKTHVHGSGFPQDISLATDKQKNIHDCQFFTCTVYGLSTSQLILAQNIVQGIFSRVCMLVKVSVVGPFKMLHFMKVCSHAGAGLLASLHSSIQCGRCH